MNGGVSQGALSRPEEFLHMIDHFETCVDDVKYGDDTSLLEIVNMMEAARCIDLLMRHHTGQPQTT